MTCGHQSCVLYWKWLFHACKMVTYAHIGMRTKCVLLIVYITWSNDFFSDHHKHLRNVDKLVWRQDKHILCWPFERKKILSSFLYKLNWVKFHSSYLQFLLKQWKIMKACIFFPFFFLERYFRNCFLSSHLYKIYAHP